MTPGAFDRWPQLDDLFDRALDLEGVERRRFLDEACGEDRELRDELERLLEVEEASGDFLDRPLGPADGDAPGGSTAGTGWSGQRVAHYDVLELLGIGGMGAVYRARDTRLDREVALKFLRPHLGAEPEARARFVREARAASALDHPNICTVYEIGETDDGQVFIAMALASGETLRSRLSRGPLDPTEALRVAAGVAAGLQRAHEAGIVHRDLKPANVMLTERGDVKILDFGIAKLEGSSQHTRAGSQIGTVAYMSPEQARGQTVDTRTDVWSFGVLLYEMLVGARPFRADSEHAVIYQILHEDPPPLPPRLGERWAGLVRLCLQRDPAARHPGFATLARELEELAGGGASTRPGTARARGDGSVGRGAVPRAGAAVGLAAALILVGVAAARLWLPGQTVPFEARGWLLIADVDNQAGEDLLEGTLDAVLTGGLSASKHVNVLPRSRISAALQLMERPPSDRVLGDVALEMGQRTGVSLVLLTTISRAGTGYRVTGRLVDPESGIDHDVVFADAPTPEAVITAVGRVVTGVRRRLGETRYQMLGTKAALPGATTASLRALRAYAAGGEAWDAGRLREAAAAWHEAVTLDPAFAQAHADLGSYYNQFNDRVRGAEHFERALTSLDRVSRGEQLWIRATYEGWRGDHERSLQILETLVGEYPDHVDAWFNLGSRYMSLRACDRAEAALDEVLRLDPTMAWAHIQAATCLSAIGELDAAIDRYERGFALDSALLTWANLNHEYGNTLLRRGDVERAELTFRRMIDSNTPSNRAIGLRSLGLLEMYRGRFGEAVSALETSATVYGATGVPLSELRNRIFLAMAMASLGRSDAYFAQLEIASAIADSINMEPYWLGLLGTRYARAGRPDVARRFLDAMEPVLSEQDLSDLAARDLLRGEIALAEGDADSAVPLFERARANRVDGLTAAGLARALVAAGRVDRAIEAYEAVLGHMELGWEAQQDWVLAHYELGRLHEARGQVREAIAFYSQFVTIWEEADVDAQPSVQAVRRRIESLRLEHGIG